MRDNKVKLPVIIGAALVAALALPGLLGWAFGWGGGGSWAMWGTGWMWFMPVLMLAFWGLLIWAVVTLVQGLSRPGGANERSYPGDSALDILKRRYARGEISREQYEEMKGELL